MFFVVVPAGGKRVGEKCFYCFLKDGKDKKNEAKGEKQKAEAANLKTDRPFYQKDGRFLVKAKSVFDTWDVAFIVGQIISA